MTDDIANNAVTSAKLASDSVDTSNILDGTITSDDLGSGLTISGLTVTGTSVSLFVRSVLCILANTFIFAVLPMALHDSDHR